MIDVARSARRIAAAAFAFALTCAWPSAVPAQTAAAADCTAQAGGPGLLIKAIVLARDGVLPRGQVFVDAGGRIACVSTDCSAQAGAAAAVACPSFVLSPGMINTHDHIAFAGVAPRPDTGERFEHRHEWRFGLDGHHKTQDFTGDTNPNVIGWGELRFLAGGTTSIAGADGVPGLVRNLDMAADLEGLPAQPVTVRVFPLDDAPGQMRTRDCDYGPKPATRADALAAHAFLAHVAEGRNDAARNEFRCESSATYDTTPLPHGGGTSNDWIVPQATLIHGVGLTKSDLALVKARGASIVWSPRSNFSLYATTLDIAEAHRLGITVALGSDWLPSGSMNLNRELACAAAFNTGALNGLLTNRDLWTMVTSAAARAVHDDASIGSIAPGMVADLALFRPQGTDPYAAVVQSSPQSTALVVRGGTVLYGDGAIVDRLGTACESITVGGAMKRLCAEPGRLSAAALETYAYGHNLYPLAFDGTPRDEPPCTWNHG